jgi:hypothetical protein
MWSDYGKRIKKKKSLVVTEESGDDFSWSANSTLSTRVQGQILLQEGLGIGNEPLAKPIDIRIVLGDFGQVGMIAFCQERLPLGHTVRVTLLEPLPFYFKARIVWNFELLSSSPVLSTTPKYAFRVGLNFIFENQQERDRILEYREQLLNGQFKTQAA